MRFSEIISRLILNSKRKRIVYSPIQYLALSRGQKFAYKLGNFFRKIPSKIANVFKKIGKFFKNIGLGIANFFKNIVVTFKDGDAFTRTSFFIMGFGSFARGQILRGILFLMMQIVFIFYMIFYGGTYVVKLNSLGLVQPIDSDGNMVANADNSFKILLYGVLTIFFIVGFIYTW